MKRLLLLPLLFLLAGCGEMIFSQQVGGTGTPPVSTQAGASVDTRFDLPVYYTWPEKPCEIIGMLHYTHVYPYWSEGKIEDAVDAARDHGANAIIMRQGHEFGPGPGHPPGFVEATALVIRWKPVLVPAPVPAPAPAPAH